MTLELQELQEGKVLEVYVSGKLHKVDYEQFVPSVDRLIEEHGPIRMLLRMHDFHGWDVGALWEDTKFAMHHYRGIERLAIVGEKRWQKGMAIVCKPFTSAQVRYFEPEELEAARAWLAE